MAQCCLSRIGEVFTGVGKGVGCGYSSRREANPPTSANFFCAAPAGVAGVFLLDRAPLPNSYQPLVLSGVLCIVGIAAEFS
jgi:hypothetical protein